MARPIPMEEGRLLASESRDCCIGGGWKEPVVRPRTVPLIFLGLGKAVLLYFEFFLSLRRVFSSSLG